jgi:hypothetical protein
MVKIKKLSFKIKGNKIQKLYIIVANNLRNS